MRNIFKGGPLDGNVIMSDVLISGTGFVDTLPIEEYDGDNPPEQSPDGIFSRVWFWTGIGTEEGNEPTVVIPNEDGDDVTVGSEGPEFETGGEQDTPPPFDPPTKPKAAPKVKDGNELIDDLRERRERIKCNRNDVSALAGLSVGVIARIETKGGTDAENKSYLDALDTLERTRA